MTASSQVPSLATACLPDERRAGLGKRFEPSNVRYVGEKLSP